MSQFWRPIYNTVPVLNNTVLHTYLAGGSLVKYSYHNRVKFKKKKKEASGKCEGFGMGLGGSGCRVLSESPSLILNLSVIFFLFNDLGTAIHPSGL